MTRSIKLALSIVICFAPAIIGGLFTAAVRGQWYNQLQKPWFMPPGWLFGPAWTLLYATMAVALFLVWLQLPQNVRAKTAIKIFIIQLVLNAVWSPVFFGLKTPALALIIIILLWLMIIVTILAFKTVSKPATLLLLPYLAWVSFATILNFSIVSLN